MRRCQVFNISAGVSVPSFAIKPGMSFYAGLRERGEHILEYVFWGVFRSLLWHVPFTINSTLFSYPLRGNGMGGVSLASDAPRHCAENGRCAVCSTPASSGGPGGTQPPCLDLPSGRLIRPSHGTHPPGPNADVVQKRSGRFCPAASPRCTPAFSPVFLTQCRVPRVVRLQRRKQKYGERNIPQKHAPECEAPFTPATVYRLALACDKPKKAGHLSVTRMTGRSSPDVRGRRQGTTAS